MKLNKDCIRDILLYVEANGQLEGVQSDIINYAMN
jgi:hypothetical protein